MTEDLIQQLEDALAALRSEQPDSPHIAPLEAAIEALRGNRPDAEQKLRAVQRSITTKDISVEEGNVIMGEGNTVTNVILNVTQQIAPTPANLKRHTSTEHVFISYAKADGGDHALQLHADLTANGHGAWMDDPNMDKERDFTAEIERAIEAATHMVVVCTPDVKRDDSFVRLEVAYALNLGIPVIPLLFPKGHRLLTIINHTYVDFRKPWPTALDELLTRLADPDDVTTITPTNPREREMAYLEHVAQQRVFNRWREIYTDMAAEAQIREEPVELTPAAKAFFGMDLEHEVFEEIVHKMHPEAARSHKVEAFDDLREAIRKKKRVALIGDPGAGKTTTLERLADELAAEAVTDEDAPLPLFVRLGAYEGGGLGAFLAGEFGGLPLSDYLPQRLFLLLDGLNEMQPEHRSDVDTWLRDHPEVPVVVSCRTLDYVGLKLPLQRVDVLPLDIQRQYLFIGNFFANEADREALFWGLAGPKNRAAWQWFKEKAKNATFYDLWQGEAGDEPYKWAVEEHRVWSLRSQLNDYNPSALPRDLYGMLGVTSNPFLLSITVRLYATSGKPVSNRGQLFEGFVRMLFKERGKPAAAVRGPWIDEETQQKGLAAISYRMQAERTGTSVDRTWAIGVLREVLPDEDAEHLLYLAGSASILEVGTKVRFTHQLLQEYFAAFQMGEDMRAGVSASKYWPNEERWWEQTGWEETAVLLAGITRNSEGELDATPVVEWLTPVQPRLAYRCATESGATCDDAALQALYEAEPPQRVAPLAKVRRGNILAERGDDRPGVGVVDGVPDIVWQPIPAGEVKIEGQTFEVKPFRMAKYPVTHAQYQAFVAAPDGYADPDWWAYSDEATAWRKGNPQPDDAYWPLANRPRETVTWFEAVAFCRWLANRTGLPVRLPSEWEWQWAAQGEDGHTYPWGDDYLPGFANIDEVGSGAGPYYLRETSAVGMYPQGVSPFGVLDMSGNVFEWCLNEYDTPENTALGGDARRVVRGGSWSSLDGRARADFRVRDLPHDRYWSYGFRVCVLPS